jgi:DNA-binding MarR family transcriptional regulator
MSQGAETHRAQIRLWLRLLACSTLISAELRRRFRDEFAFTLPRFEILAQLDRQPGGVVLGSLSRNLMVSPANLTPIIARLIKDGLVTREPSALDRRVQIVCLTVEGQRKFRKMAKKHGEWLVELMDGLSVEDVELLSLKLSALKSSLSGITLE